MPAARAKPSGDIHTTKITPLLPPPPVPGWLYCQCPVVAVGKRVSIVSRVSGFQGPRVNGSQGLNDLKGNRSKGLRVSRERGFPHVNRGFQRFGISKIQRLQGPRDEGFQGSKVQALKG
jgi:hypothetical protein